MQVNWQSSSLVCKLADKFTGRLHLYRIENQVRRVHERLLPLSYTVLARPQAIVYSESRCKLVDKSSCQFPVSRQFLYAVLEYYIKLPTAAYDNAAAFCVCGTG